MKSGRGDKPLSMVLVYFAEEGIICMLESIDDVIQPFLKAFYLVCGPDVVFDQKSHLLNDGQSM